MKILRYNPDRKEYQLEVRKCLTDEDICILRLISNKKDGQWICRELYPSGEDDTQKEVDGWTSVFGTIINLTDYYLLERTVTGPFDDPEEIFRITDSGKLLLKMVDGQLIEKGE